MHLPEASRPVGRATVKAFILGLAAVTITGCGSSVSGTPVSGEVDIRNLNVGQYPTDPLDYRTEYWRLPSRSSNLAAARLANAVVIGATVDPSFAHGVMARAISLPAETGVVLANVAESVANNNNMMFGFTASASTHAVFGKQDYNGNFNPFDGAQSSPDATTFNVTVLQFPDQQQARAAALQLESADFDVAPDQNVRVTLDEQPTATAHWRPGIPSMAATLSHQNYVVSVFVQQPQPQLDNLRALAQKVFAAQLSLLDTLPALSARDVLRMEYDPDGMMRRTLHPPKAAMPDDTEATWAPNGYLHYVDDQRTWKRLLDEGGVDRISTASEGGLLLRARDVQSATTLWAGINEFMKGSTDGPTGVPDAACIENPNPKPRSSSKAWDASDRYICTLRYDRYVARVAGSQLADVHQRAAAQYALLAKSQYM